jgi:hypothetical protein
MQFKLYLKRLKMIFLIEDAVKNGYLSVSKDAVTDAR